MTAAGAITIMFLWTNPALNADGTVCRDLAGLNLHGVREATMVETVFPHPLCLLDDSLRVVCHSGPGLPDTMRVELPRPQGSDPWDFAIFAYDSTGNNSDRSNVVRVDIGDQGPVTGVDPQPVAQGKEAPVEWFDVQGRKIAGPVASGVYFRRQGKHVEKWIRLK